MKSLAFAAAVSALALVAAPAQAATIAQNQDGPLTTISAFFGQSFTATGTGAYNNIAFNFYDSGSNAYAAGKLYVFDTAYSGTVNGLTTANYLGVATAAGNLFSFGTGLVINSGKQYFAYSDSALSFQGSPSNPYAGGRLFRSDSATSTYAANASATGEDARFLVTGSVVAAAVPEPATWALMILGMGAVGFAMRRRSKVNTTVRFA